MEQREQKLKDTFFPGCACLNPRPVVVMVFAQVDLSITDDARVVQCVQHLSAVNGDFRHRISFFGDWLSMASSVDSTLVPDLATRISA